MHGKPDAIPGSRTGAVLAQSEILLRLHAGEIFLPGTWSRDNVRAAAYDLRIAEDFMIVPDPNSPGGRRYGRGSPRKTPIILKQGDVAFFSSKERLSVPWDLAGHIGIKFGLARRGVLVLTGLLVDPGFGQMKSNDQWVPKEDERLHFVLANVGPNDVVLTPGSEKIASIQFLTIVGTFDRVDVPSASDMDREFFDPAVPPSAGLSFFRDMAQIRSECEAIGRRINTVESATNQVVMFGVFLLAASVLVGAFTTLLSLLSSDHIASVAERLVRILPTDWPAAASLISLCVVIVCILFLTARDLSRRATKP